jgi:thioredoxin 2
MAIVACRHCGAKNRVDERAERLRAVCGKCGSALEQLSQPPQKPLTVTDASFTSEILRATRPVLLDCWAPWCGPCQLIGPIVDQLAAESNGRYLVAKLNVDENPGVAGQFRVESIPTLLIFKSGRLVDRIIGVQSKEAISRQLARHAG